MKEYAVEAEQYELETERLLHGYPDDTCAECGADISELDIGVDLCENCSAILNE